MRLFIKHTFSKIENISQNSLDSDIYGVGPTLWQLTLQPYKDENNNSDDVKAVELIVTAKPSRMAEDNFSVMADIFVNITKADNEESGYRREFKSIVLGGKPESSPADVICVNKHVLFKMNLIKLLKSPFIEKNTMIVEVFVHLRDYTSFSLTSEYNFENSESSTADLVFNVEGTKLYAHQSFLASHSSVIKDMLQQANEKEFPKEMGSPEKKMRLDQSKDVIINGIAPEVFRYFLKMIYVWHFQPNDLFIKKMLRLAERFRVTCILDKCEKYLINYDGGSLSREIILVLAYRFNLPNLKLICLRHFNSVRKFQPVFKCAEYYQLHPAVKSELCEAILSNITQY